MNITILCVGKIKEKFFADAISEYKKRLSGYCRLDVIEVEDESTRVSDNGGSSDLIKEREGQRIEKYLDKDAYKIALAINGKKFDSPGFSQMLDKIWLSGKSHIIFVIGGSVGLSDSVLGGCDMKLSFSDMTFPHQLMRVILLEQVYRAFRISKNEPYHK